MIRRYSRQAVVPGFGVAGQARLATIKLAIVGLGGLGSPVLQYLATAGVGELGIVDHDSVELHNLQRQVLHRENTVGWPKTKSAAQLVRQMNSTVIIREHPVRITRENVKEELDRYDVVVDCTDGVATRYVLNDYCRNSGKLFVCGAVLGWEGQVCVVPPSGRCFRCLFHGMKQSAAGCDQRGVVGPVCGLVGSLQAVEVIKAVVSGVEKSQIICINGMTNSQRRFSVKGRCECDGMMSAGCERVSVAGKTSAGCEEAPSVTWQDIIKDDRVEDYQVVDIRTEEHYIMARVKGSVNMIDPVERVEELKKDGRPVAVVCYRGKSAVSVAMKLREMGLEAYRVIGGIQELIDKCE